MHDISEGSYREGEHRLCRKGFYKNKCFYLCIFLIFYVNF